MYTRGCYGNNWLVASGGIRGGQPIFPNAYSGLIKRRANSLFLIEATPISKLIIAKQ